MTVCEIVDAPASFKCDVSKHFGFPCQEMRMAGQNAIRCQTIAHLRPHVAHIVTFRVESLFNGHRLHFLVLRY